MRFFSALVLLATISASAQVAGPMKDVNGVVDNTPDSIAIARMARPVPGSSRVGDRPVLFLVGNSTMRTGTKGDGRGGQWGWGYFMSEYVDPEVMSVENQALGGMSSRTFYNVLWPEIRDAVRPGDRVVIELGHNDNGPYDSGRARASIPGIGTDSLCVTIQETGKHETVYTYGEYMRRYINEVKERGGLPILMSLTPRLAWDDADSTRVTRVNETFGLWARQVAEAEGVPFVDLNEITARKYEAFGKDKVSQQMFYTDRIHTSALGARINAESAAEGLRECPDSIFARAIVNLPETITPAPREAKTFVVGNTSGLLEAGIVDCREATHTARSFIDEGLWDKVYNQLLPGDTVIVDFEERPSEPADTVPFRGELPGAEEQSKVLKMQPSGRYVVVYTHPWYIRRILIDAASKGAKGETRLF